MIRYCPHCGDLADRSSIHSDDSRLRLLLLSPYRCNSCGKRFWLISSRIRSVLIGIASVGALAAVVIIVTQLPSTDRAPAQPTQSKSRR